MQTHLCNLFLKVSKTALLVVGPHVVPLNNENDL